MEIILLNSNLLESLKKDKNTHTYNFLLCPTKYWIFIWFKAVSRKYAWLSPFVTWD